MLIEGGARIVKYMGKIICILKPSYSILFWVKRLKVVAKSCLKLRFFHDAINCCLRYSNMDYQDEIFKTNH